MALAMAVIMLLVMTIGVMGIWKLVDSIIGVSASYYRKTTTRGAAVAQSGMLMETIANSITAATVAPTPGLIILEDIDKLYQELSGGGFAGIDYSDSPDPDSPNFNPDFRYTIDNIEVYGDVDFAQRIPLSGGSIEFASAYDGVGQGQTLGSSFVIQNHVRVIAVDPSGARTEVRFMAVR